MFPLRGLHWLRQPDFCLSGSHAATLQVFHLCRDHVVCDISFHDQPYRRLLRSRDISHPRLSDLATVSTPSHNALSYTALNLVYGAL